MPTYQVAHDSIIETIMTMVMNNQILLNVLHFMPETLSSGNITDGQGNLDEFITAIDDVTTGWSEKRAVYTSTDLTIDSISAQYIHPVRYTKRVQPATNNVGTQPGDPAPQNVSAGLTWQPYATGRHNRSTIKIPGLTAAVVAGGTVSSVVRGHMDDEASFLTTGVSVPTAGINYLPIIYQRGNPYASNYIVAWLSQRTARVVRRRTVGHGK